MKGNIISTDMRTVRLSGGVRLRLSGAVKVKTMRLSGESRRYN